MKKREKLNNILILMLAIFLLSNINAGLQISPNVLYINKTFGIDSSWVFNVTNTEAFTFSNLSLLSNNLMTIAFPGQIASGQTIQVNGTVNSNINSNQILRVKGNYFTNVGQQYKTYEINISSYDGILNPCDFTIIKGDSVRWTNKLNNQIVIKDINNNVDAGIIPGNGAYTIPFNAPTSFRYAIYVSGFQLTNICTVTVLDSNGYVNDPSFDATINLTTHINFEPTILNYSLLTNNFSMEFFATQEGMMSVTNTGGKPAYGVKLEGDWFTFSTNNFNMNSGEMKGIIFNINPIIYSTNDTNKTYIKNIKISGNFPTIEVPVLIHIKYANFGDNGTSQEDINYLLQTFCPLYPNSILCNGTGQNIIYKYVNNNSDPEVNVSYTSSQVRDLWIHQLQKDDETTTFQNYVKDNLNNVSQTSSNATTLATDNAKKYAALEEKIQNDNRNLLVVICIFFAFLILALIGGLIFFYRKQTILNKLRVWAGTNGRE